MLALLLSACATSPLSARSEELVPPVPSESYAVVRDRLAARREALASTYATVSERPLVRREARDAVLTAITQDLIPHWTGTTWDYYGTTQVPGEGEIACGYFVSTILRDAGFRVERVKLAQQAAEHIELTFVPKKELRKFRDGKKMAVDRVIDDAAREEGLYLVGLDNHVGFLWNDGSTVQMCHSSYLAGGVVCEDARTSPAMPSGYTVTAKLLEDPMIDAWIEGRAFPTVGPQDR
jgi:hypothetical protein